MQRTGYRFKIALHEAKIALLKYFSQKFIQAGLDPLQYFEFCVYIWNVRSESGKCCRRYNAQNPLIFVPEKIGRSRSELKI